MRTHTLEGHTSSVWCLQVINKYTLASGSADKTIKLWDFNSKMSTHTLEGNSFPVFFLLLIDKYTLARGSGDTTIKNYGILIAKCAHILLKDILFRISVYY